MRSGTQTASHSAPASQTGQTGKVQARWRDAQLARDQIDELAQRRVLGPGENVSPSCRRGTMPQSSKPRTRSSM